MILSPLCVPSGSVTPAFCPWSSGPSLTSMAAPPEPDLRGDVEPFVVGPVVLVLGSIALTLLNRLVLQPTVVAGARSLWGRRPGAVTMPTVPSHIRQRTPEAVETGAAEAGQPVLRRLSVFQGSGGDYDDSWEIQAGNSVFLGGMWSDCRGLRRAGNRFPGFGAGSLAL